MEDCPLPEKHILQIFASPAWGGGEQYVYDLSVSLMSLGHKMFFVSRKSADIDKKLNSLSSVAQKLPLKFALDLWSIWRLTRTIEKNNIDVIHTHIFKDAFVALFARKWSSRHPKVILTRHLVKRGKTNWLYRWLYKEIDKIIFVSQMAKDEFTVSMPKIDQKKIVVVHNSILPIKTETEGDIRKHYGISENTILFAFVGRVVKEKGIETLLEAVSSLHDLDFHLFVLGKGENDYERMLQKRISDLGLEERITFVGFLSNVSGFISQVDFGVMPSVCRESFGLSLIEFMQVQKAVIATDNGAQPEIISNGKEGILVSPEDVINLRNAIEELILDEAKRKQMGTKAKETFDRKFSYQVFLNKILSIYSA